MPKKALIIVDVQNDFCPGGALPVTLGDLVIKPINKMIEYAQRHEWLIVASRDWHPAKTKHFKDFGDLWPVHCVQNSEGAKFHPQLKLPPETIIISKGMKAEGNAYSGFDGYTDNIKSLGKVLNECGITEVYVGGLATDYCVKATALDAVQRGLRTYLLIDACRAVNIKLTDGLKAVKEMKETGVIITDTEEVMKSV